MIGATILKRNDHGERNRAVPGVVAGRIQAVGGEQWRQRRRQRGGRHDGAGRRDAGPASRAARTRRHGPDDGRQHAVHWQSAHARPRRQSGRARQRCAVHRPRAPLHITRRTNPAAPTRCSSRRPRGCSAAPRPAPGAVEELIIGDNLYLTGTTLSATSRNSTFVNYSYSTATTAPPGVDQIRFDAGYPYTAVTKVWIRNDHGGRAGRVSRSADRADRVDACSCRTRTTTRSTCSFTTTGTPIDNTTYVEFPVRASGARVEPSAAGSSCSCRTRAATWAAALTTQQKMRALTVVFGTGSAMRSRRVCGPLSRARIPATITAARLLAVDARVTAAVDRHRRVEGHLRRTAPPTVADTITASAKPTLSSATKSEDTTLTGWTTAVTAGDVFGFMVDSASDRDASRAAADRGAGMTRPLAVSECE